MTTIFDLPNCSRNLGVLSKKSTKFIENLQEEIIKQKQRIEALLQENKEKGSMIDELNAILATYTRNSNLNIVIQSNNNNLNPQQQQQTSKNNIEHTHAGLLDWTPQISTNDHSQQTTSKNSQHLQLAAYTVQPQRIQSTLQNTLLDSNSPLIQQNTSNVSTSNVTSNNNHNLHAQNNSRNYNNSNSQHNNDNIRGISGNNNGNRMIVVVNANQHSSNNVITNPQQHNLQHTISNSRCLNGNGNSNSDLCNVTTNMMQINKQQGLDSHQQVAFKNNGQFEKGENDQDHHVNSSFIEPYTVLVDSGYDENIFHHNQSQHLQQNSNGPSNNWCNDTPIPNDNIGTTWIATTNNGMIEPQQQKCLIDNSNQLGIVAHSQNEIFSPSCNAAPAIFYVPGNAFHPSDDWVDFPMDTRMGFNGTSDEPLIL